MRIYETKKVLCSTCNILKSKSERGDEHILISNKKYSITVYSKFYKNMQYLQYLSSFIQIQI